MTEKVAFPFYVASRRYLGSYANLSHLDEQFTDEKQFLVVQIEALWCVVFGLASQTQRISHIFVLSYPKKWVTNILIIRGVAAWFGLCWESGTSTCWHWHWHLGLQFDEGAVLQYFLILITIILVIFCVVRAPNKLAKKYFGKRWMQIAGWPTAIG